MLRGPSIAAALAIAPAMVLMGALLSPVAACGSMCGGDGEGSADSGGQTVTVQVSGSFVSGGSGGSGGSSGSTTVQVSPPCVFRGILNGKQFYEFWYGDGDQSRTIGGPKGGEEATAPPGTKKHKKDTEGLWYHPFCSTDDLEYAQNFIEQHGWSFVPAGTTPPTPPIPRELLLEAAEESLAIPQPQFEWNPKRSGNQGTLVNLPTWFWLGDGYPTSGSVTATAGNNSVTVELSRSHVEFWSAEAGSVTCDDGGDAWSPGSESDCTLAFGQAGDHTVQAQTDWQASWSFNGTPQGSIDPLSATWEDQLAVDEVQSVVTSVD